MIVSIVDRPRPGLVEHSEALVKFLQCCGLNTKNYIPKNFCKNDNFSESFSILKLFNPQVKKIIIWSTGITYFALPLLRLMGKKIIVVIHEPGGITQRLRKGDSYIYSLFVTLIEIFLIFATIKVTPNKKNSSKSLFFAPLLLENKKICKITNKDLNKVLYLGRKDKRRSFDLFMNNSLRAKNKHLRFAVFPSKKQFTFEQKIKLMKKVFVVLNLYKVNHNQSGVTIDSLSFGRPIIISEKDAFSELIIKNQLGVVIPSDQISIESINSAIEEINNNRKKYSKNINKIFNREFGFDAFKKYWLCLI